ncbi:MAG: hypothetical protein JXA30_08525 [Deltaproteobacteria bacterium]|nr:hypothetical protein [Deltaproteobacteria bacterium]
MRSEKRYRNGRTIPLLLITVVFVGGSQACQKVRERWEEHKAESKPKTTRPKPEVKTVEKVEEPPPMVQPVAFWENGKSEKMVDAASADLHGYLVLDLGEEWTPYIFSDGVKPDGEPAPNDYRKTYIALAQGDFPDDHHGERAKDDKYLELYGITPTLALLRKRFRETKARKCIEHLDLQPIIDYQGFVSYVTNQEAAKNAGDFVYLRSKVHEMMRRQKVDTPEALDESKLNTRAKAIYARYQKVAPEYYAIRAVQDRLKCEGFFVGKGRYVKGGLDWATHEALAEFERRHRVYGWGYFGTDTLNVLKMSPLEAEREGVLRVLTERAMHAARVVEDGTTSTLANEAPRTFLGSDGKQHPVPNLWAELSERIVNAFELQTPESTLAWLEALGELPKDKPLLVAIRSPQIPEYYDGNMDLLLEYDRGDVWYDFPYNDQGQELAQPVTRRPRITLSVRYNSQKIPLARFGTTIGGWRSEKIGDHIMWKYKESPVGWRVWQNIVAAPVWLPPDGTPPRDVLKRRRIRKANEPPFEINYDETGPSYASAYGLVAAYHKKYLKKADGTIIVGGDEGIRTHGSVDYMSIMRRHSHGCHRLHNHLAVRLMSFILAHRPHKRLGHQPLSFSKIFEYEGEKYQMDMQEGGYIFEFDQPLEINVLEGRIKGKMKAPIEIPVPKYDADAGGYIHPDAGPVILRQGQLLPAPPPLDAGIVPFAGYTPPGTTIPPTATVPPRTVTPYAKQLPNQPKPPAPVPAR